MVVIAPCFLLSLLSDPISQVVTRWSSGLDSGDVFWTDANGREMMAIPPPPLFPSLVALMLNQSGHGSSARPLAAEAHDAVQQNRPQLLPRPRPAFCPPQKRVLNHRDTWSLTADEPVAANYYPVTAMASVKGVASSAELLVVTDRSQGATSLSPEELEFMVHRRYAVHRVRTFHGDDDDEQHGAKKKKKRNQKTTTMMMTTILLVVLLLLLLMVMTTMMRMMTMVNW